MTAVGFAILSEMGVNLEGDEMNKPVGRRVNKRCTRCHRGPYPMLFTDALLCYGCYRLALPRRAPEFPVAGRWRDGTPIDEAPDPKRLRAHGENPDW